MCPVYKVTRDESATPRAKANILRMLISGAIDDSQIYQEGFQNVISQCISCGSCFHECPSGVNIPKMAMEARAAAISRFGASFHETLVVSTERAGKAAGKFSRLLTPFLDMPAVKTLGRKVTGIASRRSLPPFAKRSLFEQIPFNSGGGAPRVLYFAGCYAGYLRPSIGEAAISVMSAMGMTVLTPKQHCCGLPMLTKGMVQQARERIEANFLSWGRLHRIRGLSGGLLFLLRAGADAGMELSGRFRLCAKRPGKTDSHQPADQPLFRTAPNRALPDAPFLSRPLSFKGPAGARQFDSTAPRPQGRCHRASRHPLLRHGRRMGPLSGSFRLEPCHRIGHASTAQCIPRGCRRNRLPDMQHADVPVQPQTDPASRGNHR